MIDELLYTQEDIDEWMRTCDELQERISEQKEQIEHLEKRLDDKCDRCIERDKKSGAREFAERLKKCLHEEDFGTPDERWKPESDFACIIDAIIKEYYND